MLPNIWRIGKYRGEFTREVTLYGYINVYEQSYLSQVQTISGSDLRNLRGKKKVIGNIPNSSSCVISRYVVML